MKHYIKEIVIIMCLCSIGISWGMRRSGYPGGNYLRDAFIWQPPPIITHGSSGVVPPGGWSNAYGTSIYTYYDLSGMQVYYYFEHGQIIYYTHDHDKKIVYFYYNATGDKIYYYR